MEVPLILQFSIALFTGMIVATFLPPVRKAIPRPVEVGLWIAFLTSCALGVTVVADKNARDLSMSAIWGAEQVLNTMFGLLLGSSGDWISQRRVAIVSLLVMIAGADVVALVLARAVRNARPWTPRVRLREWMELPVPAQAIPVREPVRVGAFIGVNRKLAGLSWVLATALLANSVLVSLWVRNLALSRGPRMSRVRARSRLESLRDATAHLQFAARAWYAAAGSPVVGSVAQKSLRTARAAGRGLKPAAERAGHVIDIRALLGAQSLGYGPMNGEPQDKSRRENGAADPERSDRLAS